MIKKIKKTIDKIEKGVVCFCMFVLAIMLFYFVYVTIYVSRDIIESLNLEKTVTQHKWWESGDEKYENFKKFVPFWKIYQYRPTSIASASLTIAAALIISILILVKRCEYLSILYCFFITMSAYSIYGVQELLYWFTNYNYNVFMKRSQDYIIPIVMIFLITLFSLIILLQNCKIHVNTNFFNKIFIVSIILLFSTFFILSQFRLINIRISYPNLPLYVLIATFIILGIMIYTIIKEIYKYTIALNILIPVILCMSITYIWKINFLTEIEYGSFGNSFTIRFFSILFYYLVYIIYSENK